MKIKFEGEIPNKIREMTVQEILDYNCESCKSCDLCGGYYPGYQFPCLPELFREWLDIKNKKAVAKIYDKRPLSEAEKTICKIYKECSKDPFVAKECLCFFEKVGLEYWNPDTSMGRFLSHEETHEEQAAAVRGDRYPDDIDPEFIPYLARINSIQDLGTKASCTGHGKDMAYLSIEILRDFEEVFEFVAPVCAKYEGRAFYSTITGWGSKTIVWSFHYSCSFFEEFTEALTSALEAMDSEEGEEVKEFVQTRKDLRREFNAMKKTADKYSTEETFDDGWWKGFGFGGLIGFILGVVVIVLSFKLGGP